MYTDEDYTRRFLIADEVGLGKTMVARGLIAKVLDHLWETVERIDVVYICSNADIARQNIRKLNVTNREDAAIASRITLLPTQVADLAQNHVNLVSFTPSTSLDLKSSLGTVEERALLYWMLKEEWKLQGTGPKNVLQGYAGMERFREHLSAFQDWYTIDSTLLEAFHKTIALHCEKDRGRGKEDIKSRFFALCETFGRSRLNIPAEERRAVSTVVGELREILAGTCVRSLEPDLIILDEFQRFKHLLEGTDDSGRLARELFEYSDETSEARVLLLSATPYKMYTLTDEASDDDHYVDFLRTLRFLLANESRTEELDQVLGEYRREMFRLGSANGQELTTIKNDLEKRLRRVMVRTERLAASADRDGMLVEAPCSVHGVEKDDPLAYRALQRVAAAVGQGDTMEYWKSAPYLLSFMDEYKLKEAFRDAIEERRYDNAFAEALNARQLLLPWQDIEAYGAIDPGNARLRWLSHEMLASGAWRILWLPPSLPYYRLGVPFDDLRLPGFTKRLVFSSWRVVPKVIATLLSYEAERQMMVSSAGGDAIANTPEARRRRRGLLQFSRTEGRLTGMPVLGMLYPSITLAREIDPLAICRDLGETPGDVDASTVVEQAQKRLDDLLAPFIARAKTSGAEDESWYWAAPILLDLDAEPGATRAWFGDADLASRWGGDKAENEADQGDDSSLWADHVAEAERVAFGDRQLGRVPSDLTSVLAYLALGGPAVTALRALGRVAGNTEALTNPVVRHAAAGIAMGFRSLFNTPEVMALLRGLNPAEPYWERALEYGTQGCLQAVLDEYAHMLVDVQGLRGKRLEELVENVAAIMRDAITLRTALLGVEEVILDPNDHSIRLADHRMRARFAARLSEEESEAGGKPTRADQVRTAFNSPFWPFVLATTSIGQEGLDFHQYCHAVVHWNLPSNPVDLEQREGRVHRYKGHAVRKNLARQHPGGTSGHADPWVGLFEAAVNSRSAGATDLEPYWVYTIPGGAQIERHVPTFPLSREIGQMDALRRSLAVYRMVFGQPRQEDLVAYLLQHVPAEETEERMASLRIDLAPPRTG
jgi:Helicase conserved C-terminal domain